MDIADLRNAHDTPSASRYGHRLDQSDMLKPALSVEDYCNRFARLRTEAVQPRAERHPGRPRPLSPVLGHRNVPHIDDLPFETSSPSS